MMPLKKFNDDDIIIIYYSDILETDILETSNEVMIRGQRSYVFFHF